MTASPKTTAPATDAVSTPAAELAAGAFALDPNGQATYRLPLYVAPGTAGLKPDLALVYGHRQPNGIVGVGWALSGVSAITRVKATYAVDGFNGAVTFGPNDRLALDGQRLINIEGGYGRPSTVYFTELQSWSRVQAGATADDGFTVRAKNGEVREYGRTADSRILAHGGSDIRVWALNARMDPNGNRIEYRYTQAPAAGAVESGAYYLSRIAYTTRPGEAARRFVDFGYEKRPDVITSYTAGHPVVTGYRLKRIVASLAGDIAVRSYELNYRRSLATRLSCLESVVEFGAAAGDAPLPPTVMTWQDTARPGFDIGPLSVLDQRTSPIAVVPMDVSGGGRTGIVQLWRDGDRTVHAATYLSQPGGDGPTYQFASDSVLSSYPATREFLPADVDGDGRTDLVVAYQDSLDLSLKLDVYLSNGTGFDFAGTFATGDTWSVTTHKKFFAVDANGDGRTDIVEAYGHVDREQGTLLYFRTYFSLGAASADSLFTEGMVSPTADPATPTAELAFWPMDVNGDGMMDLVRVWKRHDSHMIVSAYVGVSAAQNDVTFAASVESDLGTLSLPNQLAFLPVDVNGDGTQDLLQVWREPSREGVTLHLSTFLCDGAGGFVAGPDSVFLNRTIDPDGFYPLGFTGGGLASLLSRWVSGDHELKFTVFTATPSGEFGLVGDFSAGQVGSGIAGTTFVVGDATGDGKAGLIGISSGLDREPQLVPYLSAGVYPDLVAAIANPLGGRVAVQYRPLTDPAVYAAAEVPAFPNSTALRYPAPLSPAQFPAQAVLGQAMYVVSAYAEDNLPASNRFNYATAHSLFYTGASINLLGRGWQGFATVAKLDRRNGRRTLQQFNQAFPFVGTVAGTRVEADGAFATDPRVPPADSHVLLSLDTAAYTQVVRANGVVPGQPIIEVLRTSSRREQFDYGADHFDYAVGQAFAYDDYGNQTLMANLGYVDRHTGLPLDPAEAVYHHSLYQNEATAAFWRLGLLRYAKVSSRAMAGDLTRFEPGDFRLERRTYAATTGNLLSEGGWDDTHGAYLVKSYAYDAYGNRVAETTAGGFVTRLDYDPEFHSFRLRTTQPPDERGHSLVTTTGYDPRFGEEVARIDANGLVAVAALDGFGRHVLRQIPLPNVAGAQNDPNAVTPLVTGTADLRARFRGAVVVTCEKTAYRDDGSGGIYGETSSLQAFPVSDGRDFLWRRRYVDGLGRERQTVRQTGQSAGDALVLTDVDAEGQPTWRSLPFFSTTTVGPQTPFGLRMAYDVLGRVISQQSPAGADGHRTTTTTRFYGAGGKVTVSTGGGADAPYVQIEQHRFFDGQDKITQLISPADDHAVTHFAFDPLGRLLRATDPATVANPAGVANIITYDSLDRRTTFDNPDQNTTRDPAIKAMTFAYDPATGLLQRQTDAAGSATLFSFDHLARTRTKVLGDGRTIDYAYDTAPNGGALPASVTVRAADRSVESSYDYAYDPHGNIARTTLTIGGEPAPFVTAASYDPQKRLVGQVSPSGTVLARTYAGGGLVAQVLGGARIDYPLEARNPQAAAGRINCGANPALVTRYTFNPAGLTYGESVANSAGGVLELSYRYDFLDQILAITDAGEPARPQIFTYAGRRLSSAKIPGFDDATYRYDASGNLLFKDGADYVYQAHFPRSMKVGGREIYAATPDACGRTKIRTVNGRTLKFEYDSLGALRSVRDANDQLIREIVSDFQGNRLREVAADGSVTVVISPTYQFTRVGGGSPVATESLLDERGVAATVSSDAAVGVRYFRRDHKGNITLTFDVQGGVVGRAAYGGYGEFRVLAATPGQARFAYESRPWEAELGLYYFGARYYDPMTGRFLTPDTQVGANDWQFDVLNRFAFELNNPVNRVDPTGHAAWWFGLVVGLVAVAAAAAIVVTGGAATPLAAAGVGALLGAGISASVFSVTHRDASAGDFAAGFLVNVAIGAVIGAATGAAASGLGSLAGNVTARVAEEGVVNVGREFLIRGAIYGIGGAAVTSAADTVNQFGSNLVDKYIMGEDVSLDDGLGRAAATGAIVGFAGGVGQAAAEARLLRATRGFSPGDVEMTPMNERTRILTSNSDSAQGYAARRWIKDTVKSRGILVAISEGSAVVDATLEEQGY